MNAVLSPKRLSLAFGIASVASLAVLLVLAWNYRNTRQTLLQNAKDQANQKTTAAAQELNSFISTLIPLVQSLADELSSKQLSKSEIEKRLQEKPIEFSGFGVAFTPYAFSEKEKLYAPYYVEQEGNQELIDIAQRYDYTKPEYTWFSAPLEKRAGFLDPYFGQTSKTILAEYSAPFYRIDKKTGEKKPAGIVYANQAINHLKHVLATLYLGRTGYWFVLSKDGSFLVHPNNQFVTDRKTIFDIAKKLENSALEQAGKQAIQGKSVFIEYDNEITNQASWLFCEPIPATNWSICGVFDKSELPIDEDILRQKLMQISLSTLLFMILLILFLTSFLAPSPARWWLTSLSISTALALEIGLLWYCTSLYPDYKENLHVITSKSMLYSYLIEDAAKAAETTPTREKAEEKKEDEKKKAERLAQERRRQLIFQYKQATYVQTGIFINHLQFITENQISIVGYVWQRYINGIHDNISRGFILPQATSITTTEISRTKEENAETIIWQVQAALNQYLSYARYPFDVKDLHVQIWHKDFDKNIILIPDLDAYRLINPHSLPGLSPDAYLAGWNMQGSHFGYKKNDYNTTFGMYAHGPFGIYQQIEKSATPELYFDITVKRRLVDTIIADLLPLSVIALLLFVILLTSVVQGYVVLGSCASVFFSMVFAQARFRAKVPSYELIYFESFYFILYAAIILIVIVSILHMLKFNIPFIRYRNNMIAKLLYWPIVLIALIVITLRYLY